MGREEEEGGKGSTTGRRLGGEGAAGDRAERLLRPLSGLSSSPLVHSVMDTVASLFSLKHTDASGPLHRLFTLIPASDCR